MKRKIYSIFFGAAMVVALTGCAKTENNTVPTPTKAPVEEVMPTQEVEPTTRPTVPLIAEVTIEPTEVPESTSTPNPEPTSTPIPSPTEIPHEHEWKLVTTEATCTKDGHSFEICECGETQNEIAIPATGHLEYTYWVAVKPSVENEGEYGNICNACGAVVNRGSIPKLTPTPTPIEFSYEKVSLEDAAVGCVVEFGFYEQDNDLTNGTEPIEWIVLDVQGEKALLLSRYGLDCKRYNDEYEEVTWETCTVRTWLNDTFYNTAFTGEQQDKIVTTRINTPDNEMYGTEGGNDTYDNIFYLSKEEADKYFPKGEGSENKYRATSATAYAQAQGATALESSKWYNGNCLWDLRSPGMVHNLVVRVEENGHVGSMGGSVYGKHGAERPALWVNLTP